MRADPCSAQPRATPFPEEGMAPSTAYNLIHDELILDGSSRFNLATFCSTWMEPEAHKLMAETSTRT